MSHTVNFSTYDFKTKKKHISINFYNRQIELMDKLIKEKIYSNRSEIIRISLDFYLSNEYVKALQKNENKIIEMIKLNAT